MRRLDRLKGWLLDRLRLLRCHVHCHCVQLAQHISHRCALSCTRILRGARSVPRFLMTHPLFVVRSEEHVHANPAMPPRLRMRLRPTPAFWLWNAIGMLLVSIPLVSDRRTALASVAASIVWVVGIVARVAKLNRHAAALGAYFVASPFSAQRAAAMAWLPAAVACLIGALAAALGNWMGQSGRLHDAGHFLGCGAVLVLFYFVASSMSWTLRLPTLDIWYAKLPGPVRDIVRASTERRFVRRPSSTWRAIPDLSREVHTSGTYEALFSEDERERPVWRRSRLYLIWYFAPIVVPLMALTLTPLCRDLANQGELLGLDNGSKLLFGVASVVWAAWSVCFFIYFGKRDFIVPLRLAERDSLRVPATLLRFPNFDVRRGARAFFVGSGAAAFNLIVVAAVPAYAGFLGLFAAADPTPTPCPRSTPCACQPSPPAAPPFVASAAAGCPPSGAERDRGRPAQAPR